MAENGRLPESDLALTALFYPGTTNGRYLRKDAARKADAMALAFMLKFGKPLYATDGYRDYATQVQLKIEKGPYAATPGTSNHGWGVALDLASGVNSFASAEHKWLRANAHKWGFAHPTWAHDGYSGNGMDEAWHWEYVGGGTDSPRARYPRRGEVGLGSSGQAAREAQELLKAAGRPIAVDGDFGWGSVAATVRYQRAKGLTVDGVVGPGTLASLKGEGDSSPEQEGVFMALSHREQEELLSKVRELHSGARPLVDNPFVEGKKFTLRTTLKSFISRLDRLEKAVESLLSK